MGGRLGGIGWPAIIGSICMLYLIYLPLAVFCVKCIGKFWIYQSRSWPTLPFFPIPNLGRRVYHGSYGNGCGWTSVPDLPVPYTFGTKGPSYLIDISGNCKVDSKHFSETSSRSGCCFQNVQKTLAPQKSQKSLLSSNGKQHPWSLTWNPKMMVSKRNLLFHGAIIRFLVKNWERKCQDHFCSRFLNDPIRPPGPRYGRWHPGGGFCIDGITKVFHRHQTFRGGTENGGIRKPFWKLYGYIGGKPDNSHHYNPTPS